MLFTYVVFAGGELQVKIRWKPMSIGTIENHHIIQEKVTVCKETFNLLLFYIIPK